MLLSCKIILCCPRKSGGQDFFYHKSFGVRFSQQNGVNYFISTSNPELESSLLFVQYSLPGKCRDKLLWASNHFLTETWILYNLNLEQSGFSPRHTLAHVTFTATGMYQFLYVKLILVNRQFICINVLCSAV